ncbi:MAG: hypothetical protein ACREJB_16335, partial [Planctomycetaceae bacterium]
MHDGLISQSRAAPARTAGAALPGPVFRYAPHALLFTAAFFAMARLLTPALPQDDLLRAKLVHFERHR